MVRCRLRFFSTTGSSSCSSRRSVRSDVVMCPSPVICTCWLHSIYLCNPVTSSSAPECHTGHTRQLLSRYHRRGHCGEPGSPTGSTVSKDVFPVQTPTAFACFAAIPGGGLGCLGYVRPGPVVFGGG